MSTAPIAQGPVDVTVRPLAERLLDPSTVKSWADADAQRAEAAATIKELVRLLGMAFSCVEDYAPDSDEMRLWKRALMDAISVACDAAA